MHRALLLPEIVATVLRTESSSPGFLYTCLLINKIFSLEASRILWHGCGAGRNIFAPAEHVTPQIQHLARIILKDARRAQFYANFIHILRFHDEGESNDFLDEARWHKELASVQFPYLEEITMYESDNATSLNTGDAVIHYMQPNLKYITLQKGGMLSDSFLDTLNRSCPKLRALVLNRISESTVSEDALLRFLNGTNELLFLDIRSGLYSGWSYQVFEVITRYHSLRLLFIPDIQDDWVQPLRHADAVSPAFPNLRHLFTGISDEALNCLVRHAPNLVTLRISCPSKSHRILALASSFTRLTKLKIHFGPQSTVNGHDLVLLAQQCSELSMLCISEEEGYRPSGSGINDSIIDEMAQNIAEISQLSLLFDRPDLLTWKSILSLARHCNNLEMLKLTCNFTWQDVVNSIQENAFPILSFLHVVLDENNREEGHITSDDEEIANAFAARFAAFAPQLETFVIVGGNEVDQSWEAVIRNNCRGRY